MSHMVQRARFLAVLFGILLVGLSDPAPAFACKNCNDIGGGCWACSPQAPGSGDWIFCTNSCGGGYCVVSGTCGHGLEEVLSQEGSVVERTVKMLAARKPSPGGFGRTTTALLADIRRASAVVLADWSRTNCRGNVVERKYSSATAVAVRRLTSKLVV